MKKTVTILLALCILFAFAACGSKDDGGITLLGTWHLCDEGTTAPKGILVFNEDASGSYTSVVNAREETKSFTYTDDGSVLKLSFEDGTSSEWSYTLEAGNLTINGTKVFTRPAAQ